MQVIGFAGRSPDTPGSDPTQRKSELNKPLYFFPLYLSHISNREEFTRLLTDNGVTTRENRFVNSFILVYGNFSN